MEQKNLAESGDYGDIDRFEGIQRCILSLVHACQCRDANCRRVSCHKMKRVVQHTKMCKKRVNASCPVCKQLIKLCCYHAKHCSRDSCSVPFCTPIRQKIAEQKRSARHADMVMIDGVQAVGGEPAASSSSAVSVAEGTFVPSPPLDNKPSAGTLMKGGIPGPSLLTQVPTMSSMSSHPQAGQPPQQQRFVVCKFIKYSASDMMPPQQQQQEPPPQEEQGNPFLTDTPKIRRTVRKTRGINTA
ncbi:TAZ zinc finger [Cooperia oncophora]